MRTERGDQTIQLHASSSWEMFVITEEEEVSETPRIIKIPETHAKPIKPASLALQDRIDGDEPYVENPKNYI